MLRAFRMLLQRDLMLAYRHAGELLTPLIFFIMVVALFPLGLMPEPGLLQQIAAGIIWTAALLSALLGLDSLFRADFDAGVLEQLAISGQPLPALVMAKILAHWLVTGLPLVIITPLLAEMLFLPDSTWSVLLVSLLLGTPVLSLLGAIGAALTVSLRGQGMLLPILILPLTVPVLIFGARAAALAAQGLDASGALYLLGALLALLLGLAPFVIAQALRVNME